MDDARLVLRLVNEAVLAGGTAVNYTGVQQISRDAKGAVNGVGLQDVETGESVELETGAVINATGSWAEKLHPSPKEGLHLRPLRGSHIVIAKDALPIEDAISFIHPDDHRPIFATPWEGGILIGTTDMDHDRDLSLEPRISDQEFTYLLQGLEAHFPSLHLSEDHFVATLAGVRPVLSEGKLAPSKESPGECGLDRQGAGDRYRREINHLSEDGIRYPESRQTLPALIHTDHPDAGRIYQSAGQSFR